MNKVIFCTSLILLSCFNAIAQGFYPNPILIGSSKNAKAHYPLHKSKLSVNEEINGVLFLHTANPALPNLNDNVLVFDYSVDNGHTWSSNVGPIMSGQANNTYPNFFQGYIYNPIGNTNTNNARAIALSAFNNQQNNTWSEIKSANSKLDGSINKESFLPINTQAIPKTLVEKIPGEYWALMNENASSDISLFKAVYSVSRDSLTWTSIALFNVDSLFHTLDDSLKQFEYSMGFSPDGNTAWIAINGDLINDTVNRVKSVFWKSSDAGNIWSEEMIVDVLELNSMKNEFGNSNIAFGKESSLVVDALGNPHFVFTIGNAAPNHLEILPDDKLGLYDLTFKNNEWTALKITSLNSYTNKPFFNSNIILENSPSVSRTTNGYTLFYTWTDTRIDNQTVPYSNDFPDMFMEINFLEFNTFWGNMNLTLNSEIEAIVRMPSVATIVSDIGQFWKLHVVNSEFTMDVNEPLNHYYLDNLEILKPGGIEQNKSIVQMSNNYPNPFNRESHVDITLKKNAKAQLKIRNMYGQLLQSNEYYLESGTHTLKLDASGLVNGIYIYSVEVDGYTLSKKMIVE